MTDSSYLSFSLFMNVSAPAIMLPFLRWFLIIALVQGWMWSFQSFFFYFPKRLLFSYKILIEKTLRIQNNFIFCLFSKDHEIRIQMFWLSQGQGYSLAKENCGAAYKRKKEQRCTCLRDRVEYTCIATPNIFIERETWRKC